MIYQIETKQTTTLKGIKLSTKNDVVNSIKMFDLRPPFKIFDEKKKDVTLEFISLLEKEGYQFIDINQVIRKLPNDLQELMNIYYKDTVSLVDLNNIKIKLVTTKDVKSINGFYELWGNKCIAIGSGDNIIIFYDCNTKSICKISADNINNFTSKSVIASSVTSFIKSLKANV